MGLYGGGLNRRLRKQLVSHRALTLEPTVVARTADLQCCAQALHAVLLGLLFKLLLHMGVPHCDTLAKYAAAIFRMSGSSRAWASSRFKRLISAWLSLTGVARRLSTASSFPRLACDTQLAKLLSEICSSCAACAWLLPSRSTSHTVSCLNWLLNTRRLSPPPLCLFVISWTP